MSQVFSSKEVASAMGVSESSLKRWVDKGLIQAEKTGGGYRRLHLDSVLVLRDCGWRASSLGNMLPFATLRRALERDPPRLMWLSVTSIRDLDQFVASFNVLFETATLLGSAIVVSGQALTADVRQRLRYTTCCDNFRYLEAFAKSLNPEL